MKIIEQNTAMGKK